MNITLGALVDTAGFVIPHNPVMAPNIPQTGNPLASELSMGCYSGMGNCTSQINGMGEFTLPLIGTTIPGQSWMYLIGIGLAAGVYFMNKRKK